MRIHLVCAVLAVGGCATTGLGSVETDVAKALISTEQENQLGLQFKGELETKQHVVYLNDPTIVDYVRGVADKVIAFGKRDRPEVKWQVYVIDDPKTVNAFATPGGYLYVYRGLLDGRRERGRAGGRDGARDGPRGGAARGARAGDGYGLEAVRGWRSARTRGCWRRSPAAIATKGSCSRTRARTRPRPTSTARATRRGRLRPARPGHVLREAAASRRDSPRVPRHPERPSGHARSHRSHQRVHRAEGAAWHDDQRAAFAPVKQRVARTFAVADAHASRRRPRPAQRRSAQRRLGRQRQR